MDDRAIMEGMLMTEKGVCDLMMHGTIESGTQNVNQAFHQALNDSLSIQKELYKKMSAKGWYQTEQAEQQKIQQLKQKYTSNMNMQN